MTTKAQILNSQYDIRNTKYSARGRLTADSRVTIFKPLPHNDIRNTRYASRNRALHLSRELYKSTLILTNKPNFQNAKTMITLYITRGYERIQPMDNCQNKPNSNPIKPNSKPIKANFPNRKSPIKNLLAQSPKSKIGIRKPKISCSISNAA